MQEFSLSPKEMVNSFWRNKYLIKKSIQREVIGRYRGSFLGILWSFFNPMFMLSVYTFVFSVVFKARWHSGVSTGSKTEFALILFSGLMVFNLFAECVNSAPTLVVGHANYVKRVIFPLEILPWISLGSALFHMFVSFIVWLVAYIALFGLPHVTILLLPIVLIPLILLIVGISWSLSALGVYLRDVSQVIGIITMAMMFLSPIFYSISNLPSKFQILLRLNPLTLVIEQARDVLLWGKIPNIKVFVLYLVCAMLIACFGFAWFQKTRKGFADVL